MELSNDFIVGIGIDEAWKVLTDLERIAPCMPGAQLQEVEGAEYRGVVKVKVGPITAQYKGSATFLERDDLAYRAVLRAEGRDARGQGNASATITATLVPDGAATRVNVFTDLAISGRAAQFGRGVMADVAAKLMAQFAAALEDDLLGRNQPAVAAATPAATGARQVYAPSAEPVDILGTAGAPVVQRLVPVAVVVVVVLALARLLRRTGG